MRFCGIVFVSSKHVDLSLPPLTSTVRGGLWVGSRYQVVTTITFRSDSIYGPNDPALAS